MVSILIIDDLADLALPIATLRGRTVTPLYPFVDRGREWRITCSEVERFEVTWSFL
jgi:hypothetical protein